VVVKELTMHIQRSQMNPSLGNPYSAAAEKALAAQRAAAVRKKLMKNAREIEGASTPEEAFMIGRWTESRHSRPQNENQ
jgi:hypothetical protein